jgi:hypothetical protein
MKYPGTSLVTTVFKVHVELYSISERCRDFKFKKNGSS